MISASKFQNSFSFFPQISKSKPKNSNKPSPSNKKLLVEQLSAILEKIIFDLFIKKGTSTPKPSGNFQLLGDRKLPTVSEFIKYVVERTKTPSPCLSLALLYLYRIKANNPYLVGTYQSSFRLILAALCVATKYLYDDAYHNVSWMQVSMGLFSLREVNQMELEFMYYLRYQLYIGSNEWNQWIATLEAKLVSIWRAQGIDNYFYTNKIFLSSECCELSASSSVLGLAWGKSGQLLADALESSVDNNLQSSQTLQLEDFDSSKYDCIRKNPFGKEKWYRSEPQEKSSTFYSNLSSLGRTMENGGGSSQIRDLDRKYIAKKEEYNGNVEIEMGELVDCRNIPEENLKSCSSNPRYPRKESSSSIDFAKSSRNLSAPQGSSGASVSDSSNLNSSNQLLSIPLHYPKYCIKFNKKSAPRNISVGSGSAKYVGLNTPPSYKINIARLESKPDIHASKSKNLLADLETQYGFLSQNSSIDFSELHEDSKIFNISEKSTPSLRSMTQTPTHSPDDAKRDGARRYSQDISPSIISLSSPISSIVSIVEINSTRHVYIEKICDAEKNRYPSIVDFTNNAFIKN